MGRAQYRRQIGIVIVAGIVGASMCFPIGVAADAASNSDWSNALNQRDLDAIARLLPAQSNVDARTSDGRTALMVAASEGQSQLVRELLARGAAIDATNARGGTALMYAATGGNPELLGLLLDQGATINARARNGWTALMLAAVRGNDQAVSVLLAHKADPNVADIYGWTPLMRAVNAGRMKSVQVLLADDRVDVNAVDDTDKTALHHAAASGSLEMVRELLAHGARTTMRDRDGKSPYEIAVTANHPDVANALRPKPAG